MDIKTGAAYFDSRNPRHAREDLEDMAAHHCTFVVHTFSEFDLYFYSAAVKEIVAISHDLGMEVYVNPWGLGKVFGGIEPLSRFVAEHPEECQRMSDGSHAPAACMHSGPFRSLMRLWVDAAADLGADLVFWDEPHFHYDLGSLLGGSGAAAPWACACGRCGELFRARFGRPLPALLDADAIRFRDDTIAGLLGELAGRAGERGLGNALCVLPDENPLVGASSWEPLAALPSIRIFGTDPYWLLYDRPVEEYVTGKTRRLLEVCGRHGKEPQAWVQAFMVPGGREREVGRAVEIFAAEGVRNIAAWAYNGTAHMNHKCHDHSKVWEVLGDAYRRVKGRG